MWKTHNVFRFFLKSCYKMNSVTKCRMCFFAFVFFCSVATFRQNLHALLIMHNIHSILFLSPWLILILSSFHCHGTFPLSKIDSVFYFISYVKLKISKISSLHAVINWYQQMVSSSIDVKWLKCTILKIQVYLFLLWF